MLVTCLVQTEADLDYALNDPIAPSGPAEDVGVLEDALFRLRMTYLPF